MPTTRTRRRTRAKNAKPKPAELFAFPPTRANFAALTPVTFLTRTAAVHPERVAVLHGQRRISYREQEERARRLASALERRGIRPGQTVSAMLPNVPAMLDAHFGVPMLGAVLNTINTRLDARTVAYILEHGESRALITDRDTGRPRGFAFVEMADSAAAQLAISLVNGKTLGDRQLTVNEARPQTSRLNGSGGYGGRR